MLSNSWWAAWWYYYANAGAASASIVGAGGVAVGGSADVVVHSAGHVPIVVSGPPPPPFFPVPPPIHGTAVVRLAPIRFFARGRITPVVLHGTVRLEPGIMLDAAGTVVPTDTRSVLAVASIRTHALVSGAGHVRPRGRRATTRALDEEPWEVAS